MNTTTRQLVLGGCAAWALAAGPSHAGIIWNENTSGDLSNIATAPRTLTVTAGTNSVIGRVGGTDSQDFLTFAVPAGFQLSSLVLAAYSSTDGQGFTGVQAGNKFLGDVFNAGSYLGYAHFGTRASNGSLPIANLVGVNILPLMGNRTIAAGSIGFTPPLAARSYTFLIQQLGSTTTYQFDYNLTAVPAPATLGVACAGLVIASRRRRSV